MIIEDLKINIYKDWNEKKTLKLSSINEIIEQIKTGGENVDAIQLARKTGKVGNIYGAIKGSIPAVAWNVKFKDGKKSLDIIETTGCLFFDKDGITKEQIQEYKTQLSTLPYVIAVWISFGANGIGCLIKCDAINQENFNRVWNNINQTIGIGFDTGAKKITQLNVISYDPDVIFNPQATSYNYVESLNENVSTSGKINHPTFVSTKSGGKAKFDEHNTSVSTMDEVSYGNNKSNPYRYTQMIPKQDNHDRVFVRFKTFFHDDFFEGELYKVIPEKIDVYEVFSRKQINEGKRYSVLSAVCANLIIINPESSKNDIINSLHWFNNKWCSPAIKASEVISIFNSVYKKSLENKLYMKPRRKCILFKLNSGLTGVEKMRIAGEEIGKLRRGMMEQNIRTAIGFINGKGEIITQKVVAEVCNKSVPTIKRYWKLFKDEINELNTSISNPEILKS